MLHTTASNSPPKSLSCVRSAPTCPTFQTCRTISTHCCASRERLRSLTVDAWAKAEAMPSDEEIARVRRLISRIETDLDELPDQDRAGVEEAITVVRSARTRMTNLGLPQIRSTSPDIRPDGSA
ncbi:hypothetical protein ACTWPB_08190 [Nocardia sp. IBHARD005]|uniref:hypothetical protein n=1 Tax=Nocardia sp. IBHARD005 TaxID=3457765 RepID=UPI0040581576